MQGIGGPADGPGVRLHEIADPEAPDTVLRLAVRWNAQDLAGLLTSLPELEAGLLAGARRRQPREVELVLAAPVELHDDAANLLLALYRLAPLLQGARTTLALLEPDGGEPVHRLDLADYPRSLA